MAMKARPRGPVIDLDQCVMLPSVQQYVGSPPDTWLPPYRATSSPVDLLGHTADCRDLMLGGVGVVTT
jgi:hypothetical protein